MARRAVQLVEQRTMDPPPKDLNEHSFYGLQLDPEQKKFRDAIWDEHTNCVWANAKAGTGKTLVATATADLLVKYGRYKNIVYIVSPCQESRLGFLPGTSEAKLQNYFSAFNEALIKIGVNPVTAIVQQDIMNQKMGTAYISCVSHVYLRGVSFEPDTVIIIDEAQNFTVPELKKVITRVHDGAKLIITGHTGQIDLPNRSQSGFERYMNHFKSQPYAAFCELHQNHRGAMAQWADELVE